MEKDVMARPEIRMVTRFDCKIERESAKLKIPEITGAGSIGFGRGITITPSEFRFLRRKWPESADLPQISG